ncbi:MAG: NAD(P)-dependent oxidoreductase, partial [Candidatus Caldarchaeum sp.]
MERVGFIGLGLMGKPMAKNLLRHGFKMAVFNRSKAPMEELASLGATPCGSSKEVAESSECVITMLPDEKAVEQVLLGRGGVLEGLAPGCVVVDMSTVSPGFSREMARRVEEKGGEMLDAPVSGSTMAAEQGALTIMVGGKPEIFEKIRPVFEAMGKNIYYMGGAGMGSFTKLCNQVAVSLNLLGVCETL